jgi:hypothetical protein
VRFGLFSAIKYLKDLNMRFFKYLIFTILSAFSINAFAITYSVQSYGGSYATPQAACASFTGQQFSTYTYPGWPEVVGQCGGKFILTVGTCPSRISSTPILVPGWTDWGVEQTESYLATLPPTACHVGCKYINPSLNGSVTTGDEMSISYNSPVPDSSCPNTTALPTTPPPNTPTKPPIQCSGDYCAQPQGNSCPAGYATQSFNNQNYCVKNGTPPLSPSNPPSSGNGFDAQGIINAVNNAATSIKNALSTGFTSVTNALGITNQKLDAANAKLDTGNGHLNDIKNNTNATNGKLDATNQKLDAANQKHDATNSKLDTGNGHLNDIKNNTNATNGKLDATNQKLDSANAKLDEIDQNGKDGNGILQQIKDFLTGNEIPQDGSLQIGNEQVAGYERENHVTFGQTCPFNQNTTVIDFGISSFAFTTNLSFICDFGREARPYVIGIGHLLALIFLLIGLRNSA